MSLPLEDIIMNGIGLGCHYNYYNGSGSCEYIRRRAVDGLSDAIKSHADKGDEIIAPDEDIIRVLKKVASSEESQYVLTTTWQACSDVIRMHMDAYYLKEPEEKCITQKDIDFIRKQYLKENVGNKRCLFSENIYRENTDYYFEENR